MVLQWLEARLIQCPPAARTLGYDRELVSIRRRSERCAVAWRPHLKASRAAIEGAIDRSPGRGRALILGAGWLHDIPLESLTRAFGQVKLWDIGLTPPVRDACGPQVRGECQDLSGLMAVAPGWARHPEQADPSRLSPLPTWPNPMPDLVCSVNLWSQLPVIPLAFLQEHWEKRSPAKDRTALLAVLAQAVLERHLAWLEQTAGATLLISDVREHRVNLAGQDLETWELLEGVRPGREWQSVTTWRWALEPTGDRQNPGWLEREVQVWYRPSATRQDSRNTDQW